MGETMIEDFHALSPYALAAEDKRRLLLGELTQLTEMHRARCASYANILSALNYQKERMKTIWDIPFIPVRLFKEMDLLSIDRA